MKYEIWCSKQGSTTVNDYYQHDATDSINMAIQRAMILFMAGDASTQIRMYKNENDYDCIQYVREIECQYKDPETGEVKEIDNYYRRIDESDEDLIRFFDECIDYIMDDDESIDDSDDIYFYWTENGFNRCYTSGLLWE